MGNKTVSLTDEIYAELVDGLKTGLDWTQFLAKHSASKGPLYNAIGRFLNDMESKVGALNEVQTELDQAGLQLDSLHQKVKEAENKIAALEETENTLNEQIEAAETKLAERSELAGHLSELGKLGFDIERLRQLREVLTEVGAKHGLQGKGAVGKFLADLRDYGAVLGAELQLKGLQTQIETKKLEAENWQAKEETLRRKHGDLTEAIGAVDALLKSGVKAEQIARWNKIVSAVGGPKGLESELGNYKSMRELLNARKKDVEVSELWVGELKGQVDGLKEQKASIEGAIKSLSTGGVQEITRVRDKAMTGLKSLLDEIRVETKTLADLKGEAGKLEKELMYARYVSAADQTVLKSFPKEVVISFLDRALSYCKLNRLNPMVRATNGLSRKYSSLSYTEVGLLDLITWAEAGLAGALQ